MNCLCERKLFLEAYKLALLGVAKTTTNPIAENILMTADDNGASLSATNYMLWVRVPVFGCEAKRAGVAVLNGEKIGKAIELVDGEMIEVCLEDGKAGVVGENRRVFLQTHDPALFPVMPKWDCDQTWKIKASDFHLANARTSFATDSVASRQYSYAGVFIELEDDRVRMIGCDGKRLSEMSVAASGKASSLKASIHPGVFKIASKMFSDPDQVIEFGFSGKNPEQPNLIRLRSESGEIAAALVEGRQPAWRKIFPTKKTATARISVEQLLEAAECAAITTEVWSKAIRLSFDDGKLMVYSSVAERGFAEAIADIEYEGKPLTVNLHGSSFIEALGKIPAEKIVTIDLLGDKDPVVLSLDDGWRYAVIPLDMAQIQPPPPKVKSSPKGRRAS